MLVSHSDRRIVSILLALGGPALLGAAIGLPFGLRKVVTLSLLLPVVVVGVTVLMAPALYIATTLVQAAPPAARVVKAMGTGLSAYGTVLVGMAPAVAFLGSTTTNSGFAVACGMLAVAGAVLVGLRALRLALGFAEEVRGRSLLVFTAWAVVSLALGAHLLAHLVA